MLDDLKYIHDRDKADALGIAEKQAAQLTHDFEVVNKTEVSGPIENIVYGAMGGSALAALISQTWPGYTVPFEICRQYHIPSYVSEKTLFIAASYSGNTEETVSALAEAEAKGAQIVVIAGGGKLQEIAEAKGYPYVVLPKAAQPRYAVLYNLKALLQLCKSYWMSTGSIFALDGFNVALESAANFLAESVKAWLPTVPAENNAAKQLAQECIGKSAVIYGGPLMFPAAYKWKISFNENAKQVAWVNQFPEFSHNEFMGWTQQPVTKPYTVIELRSELEHSQIGKRFEVTERLLSGMGPAPEIVHVEGQSLLEQLLWVIALGDFVALYTALLNGIDPAPVDLIEKFKRELTA